MIYTRTVKTHQTFLCPSVQTFFTLRFHFRRDIEWLDPRLPRPYCTLFALSRALSQSPASRLIEQNVTCTGIGSRDQQPLSFVSVLIFDIWRVSVKLLVKPATLLFYEVWKPALCKSNDSFGHTKQMSIIDHRRFENKSLILITVNQT